MDDTVDSEIVRRLDLLLGVVGLAFDEQIRAGRDRARTDPVTAALLDGAADDWTPSGELRAAVMKQTGAADRTVSRRLAELVARRAMLQRGSTTTTAYRSSGLL
ncbi:MAG TPA: hypothetical protein VNB24_09145 [Acidimicrobiales bacterium]|nr:hypothetical protein [Acidimicrobiales bacterium]